MLRRGLMDDRPPLGLTPPALRAGCVLVRIIAAAFSAAKPHTGWGALRS